jgi:YVTN family beta-propeller protein
MTGRRRSALQDRELGVDLFEDPPWGALRERRSRGWWIGHVGFAVLVGVVGLFGILIVVGIVIFSVALGGFKLNFHGNLIPPPSSNGIDIALSPNGALAYVTEPSTDVLVVVSTWTGATVARVPVGDTPSGLAVSPNGAQVWVANTGLSVAGPNSSTNDSVSVISTATNTVVGTVAVGLSPIDVAFSPDGRAAFVTNNGGLVPGSVSVIDTSTLKVVWMINLDNTGPEPSDVNPTSIAVTPDGRQLWVSEVSDLGEDSIRSDHIVVFDTATLTQVARIPVGAGSYFMVLSHDGRDAYVADKGSCDVRQIDTSTFQVIATVTWPKAHGCPFGLAAGPNDNLVYTVTGSDHSFNEAHAGTAFGSVNFATASSTIIANVGKDPVTVALSPDGTTAYVVDADLPRIDLIDPGNGAIRSSFPLTAKKTAATSGPTSSGP